MAAWLAGAVWVWLAGWLTGWLAGGLVGWLVGWILAAGWLLACSLLPSIYSSNSEAKCWSSFERSGGNTANPSRDFERPGPTGKKNPKSVMIYYPGSPVTLSRVPRRIPGTQAKNPKSVMIYSAGPE